MRKSHKPVAVLSVASLILFAQLVMTATPSSADPGVPPPPAATPLIGSSVQPAGGIPGKGAPVAGFVEAKRAMASEYAAARAGTIPMDRYRLDQRAFEAKWFGPSPIAPWATSADGSPTTAGGRLASPMFACCQSHDLAMSQAPQQKTYYCGAGAAYSVLAYLGFSTSHDGESLSQTCIGGSCGPGAPTSQKYLETDYWGNTPWYVSQTDWPVPGTLNYWRTGVYTGFYAAELPSTEGSYETELTYDIDNYWPTMPDVWEQVGNTHLWGHPNVDIKHWIAAFGYSNYGAGTDYVDPAANSVVGWTSVQAYNYNYPSSSMYYMMGLFPYGHVW